MVTENSFLCNQRYLFNRPKCSSGRRASGFVLDILNFRAELRDKRWAFNRFLRTLATKKQSESEIRDEIEWMVNEYTKAMNIHRIKMSQSFIDVFVISPLEIMEDLVKLNWAKIAKGMLSVKKREVEMLEAEMKAPGKECAYVFDARKRFSRL
jgi:hypothetical protein